MATDIQDIREAFQHDTDAWLDVRNEARRDMRFVGGDPWDDDDKKARKHRPTVAPEELSQYRNQVINALMANPRGMKFAPIGNGANDKTAQFYQNKAREIEYRSHAKQAYILAADNALQRSYGFVRIKVDYANPRSANQEIWIEGFPNPDMVLPDSDALRPDGADMQRCFIHKWMLQSEFTKQYPKAKRKNFAEFASSLKSWVQGNRILVSEAWMITTRPRKLLLVQPPTPPAGPMGQPSPAPRPVQIFADEFASLPPGATAIRDLRSVDYPSVKMHLTNGIEILSEHDWLGKFIPVVTCYGKTLYTDGDEGLKRTILSMTRFGRDPWKAYAYACSQQLEVLAMVPKAPLLVPRGSMSVDELKAVQESMHQPKAYLTWNPFYGPNNEAGDKPERVEYVQAQYLQSLELVKEGFRRAIQAAMGSNFLPTQAQRHNEKSGVALDKIDQAAAQGTYHFVNSYEDLIRQTGVIIEDLMDKIYDFSGETGTIGADGKAQTVAINTPSNEQAISTAGDHLVTVSTAPSSDSEREAAADFTDLLVGKLEMVAGVAGPKAAAAILARAIRMRNLGPQGDQLADLIEPAEYKQQDGEPPNPELAAASAQIQHLTQLLQQAAQEKHAKVVEQQGKFQIVKYQTDAASQDKAADREVKLAVAELSAKIERIALFLEERARLGEQASSRDQSLRDRLHDSTEQAKDRIHQRLTADAAHTNAMEQADQAAGHASDAAVQQAALTPPDQGANA